MINIIVKNKEELNIVEWNECKRLHSSAFAPIWDFEPEMKNVSQFVLSVNEDEQIIGFISLEKYIKDNERYLHISDIVVSKEYRRYGLAFKMCLKVLEVAHKGDNIITIHSWVKEKNMYSHHGQSDNLISTLGFEYEKDIHGESNGYHYLLKRYINKNWRNIKMADIKNPEELIADKEERIKLSKEVIYRSTNSIEEFRAIVFYMKEKYPEMWRAEHKIQWKFKTPKNNIGFYATILYDNKENMEPIGFASGWMHEDSKTGDKYASGGIMYIIPRYRRMGLASKIYAIHEQKIRDLGGKYAVDVQIGANVEVSKKLGYQVINPGRLTKDGTYSQVKVLIPVDTEESEDKYKDVIEKANIEWNKPIDFSFLDRYGWTIEYLNSPWTVEGFKEDLHF